MINLPAAAVEVLEKVMNAEHEFEGLFKALATGGGGLIAVPNSSMVPIHTNLLLHVIANLVEAQTEIGMLKGQIAILKDQFNRHYHDNGYNIHYLPEDNSDGNGTNEQTDKP